MKWFHKNRLLKLAEFLDIVTSKKFDINLIIISKTIPHSNRAQYTGKEYREDCGTVACAMGYACLIPEFNKAGLNIEGFSNIVFKTKNTKERDHYAIEAFFGINTYDRRNLFCQAGYIKKNGEYKHVTPKMVSTKIRKFIKEKQNASVL